MPLDGGVGMTAHETTNDGSSFFDHESLDHGLAFHAVFPPTSNAIIIVNKIHTNPAKRDLSSKVRQRS
jgi:hypothetical protein